MSKRRKMRKANTADVETRGVEVLTIVWMLSVTTTLICNLGSVAARWLAWLAPDGTQLGMLSGLLLFAAAVIGSISIALTALVVRVRRRRPPRGIVVFAVVIAGVPLGIMLIRLST